MREISLDRLRTLLAVADLGSFAAAAQALHLAPPTVTLHVAELERRVGAPLLTRARAGTAPTALGQTLIEHGRHLLADADTLIDTLAAQATGRLGVRVRVGASTGVLAHLLPQALQRLKQSQPALDVQVAVLTSAETLARLAAGTLDLGLVAMPQRPPPGVVLRAWRRDPVRAFVPADWAAPHRLSPAWLAARPLILNDAGTQLSRLTLEWFARAGLHPRARIELNYNEAAKALVAAGYGAALLPHEAGAPDPDARVRVHTLTPALWRPLGMAWRRLSDDATLQAVRDALTADAADAT